MSDRLEALLYRFEPRARVFYTGNFCSLVNFDARPGTGHLHLLRGGLMEVIGPEGRSDLLSEPSLLFFPGAARHQLRASHEGGVDLICASVLFGQDFGNPLVNGLPPLIILPLASAPSLASVLELLFNEAFGTQCGRGAALDRLSELLLIHLLRHVMETNLIASGLMAGLSDGRLAKALTAIHAEPGRPWNLDKLAQIAGMSRARFAAHFSSVVGTSPGGYLADWRISVAQKLLARGRQVKAIAVEVGYGSANALTRAFVQRVGVTPSEWLMSRKSVNRQSEIN